MPKQSQLVTLDTNSPSFKTAGGAAAAVSKDFALTKDSEQAAVVIRRPDGTYGYSTVAPQQTHDSFALRAGIPKEYSLAGIVHSHPGTDAIAGVFSPQDLQVAESLKVPSFIRFNNDNSLRQYVPGTTKTQQTFIDGSKFGVKSALGDPVEQELASIQPTEQVNTTATPRDNSVTQY